MKHTMQELQQWQALPLTEKIRLTQTRIAQWYRYYDGDVFVSFSGGKDSTVLLDICRKMYPMIDAVYVNTGLEYPEIVQFVKRQDNVTILKPSLTFRDVICKYGYPLFSKEISRNIWGAREYLRRIAENPMQEEISYRFAYEKIMGLGEFGADSKLTMMRYKFMIDSPFEVSNQCCTIMKKKPLHQFERESHMKPITAQMASESYLRTKTWLKNGCNAFDSKNPISNPMSFWTEQDVLTYIKENEIEIAPVYGDVVVDYSASGQVDNQMNFSDFGIFDLERPLMKTTGCTRTGCFACGYGMHLEKESRIQHTIDFSDPHLADWELRGGVVQRVRWNVGA